MNLGFVGVDIEVRDKTPSLYPPLFIKINVNFPQSIDVGVSRLIYIFASSGDLISKAITWTHSSRHQRIVGIVIAYH